MSSNDNRGLVSRLFFIPERKSLFSDRVFSPPQLNFSSRAYTENPPGGVNQWQHTGSPRSRECWPTWPFWHSPGNTPSRVAAHTCSYRGRVGRRRLARRQRKGIYCSICSPSASTLRTKRFPDHGSLTRRYAPASPAGCPAPGASSSSLGASLNDLRLKTEIIERLKTGHAVLLVSPPATRPAFTFDATAEKILWKEASTMARHAFRRSPVSVFNVMSRMKDNIVAHGQPYKSYMKGEWDPNTRGHRLAARILAEELMP